jgi:phage tail-like protein
LTASAPASGRRAGHERAAHDGGGFAVTDVSTRDPALTMCFSVEIDGHSLGLFTGCEGLGCEVEIEQREEGGNNEFVHMLPVRIKYSNVKLTRALNDDSKLVASWFASMRGQITRTMARIGALGADGSEVTHWTLQGVIPVRWQGPSFSVDTEKAAIETLELAHHGFLGD